MLWDTSQGISQETEIGPFSIMLAGMLRFWSYYTIPLIRQKRHMNIRGYRLATFVFDDVKVEAEVVESSLPIITI